MSRRAFTLPFRAIAPSTSKFASQWTCRRCLATQAEVPSTAQSDTVPPNYDPTLPFSQRIGPDGQHYNLKKSDRMLKKPLKQRLPPQYLQHSTSEILHESEKAMRQESVKHKKLVGVVVSSGRMKKTVTVRVNGQKWNKRIGKMFPDHEQHLVHDPNNSLVTGDVIELHRLKVSRRVEHVVASIVSPFGDPIESRPPIPTADERLAKYKEYRFKKLLRREKRARAAEGDAEAVQELKNMGLEPGAEAEAAVRRKDAELKAAEKSEGSTEGVVLAEDREALEGGAAQGRRSKPERKTVEQKREERRLLRERAAEQMEVEAK